MLELAELSAETRDIALTRFRLLETDTLSRIDRRSRREFPFGPRNLFRLFRHIAP